MTGGVLHAIQVFLEHTSLSRTIREPIWMWPALESLHFIGMPLLLGSVGLFDLRLMGYARAVPVLALHRLIPLGICGFVLNAATGLCFLTAYPDQYLYNVAFQTKVFALSVAGLNMALFYIGPYRKLALLGPGAPLPLHARVAGAVSLLAWVVVMTSGRLLTFYRGMTGLVF